MRLVFQEFLRNKFLVKIYTGQSTALTAFNPQNFRILMEKLKYNAKAFEKEDKDKRIQIQQSFFLQMLSHSCKQFVRCVIHFT